MVAKCILFMLIASQIQGSVGIAVAKQGARNCADNCYFNFPTVNSQNIELFPKDCETVCGNLDIDSSFNLTEDELANLFKSMKHLIGYLKVKDTSFKSVKFLAGLESIQSPYRISFESNKYLEEIGMLNLTTIVAPSIEFLRLENFRKFNIPKLTELQSGVINRHEVTILFNMAAGNFCMDFDEMRMFLQLENARLDSLLGAYCVPTPDSEVCTIPAEGCTRMLGHLVIGPDTRLDEFKSVETIFGSLSVVGTNLENLNFLKNLRYVATLEAPPIKLFEEF